MTTMHHGSRRGMTVHLGLCLTWSLDGYEARGVDVLRYEDQDPNGRTHTTCRLVSARALASVSVVEGVAS